MRIAWCFRYAVAACTVLALAAGLAFSTITPAAADDDAGAYGGFGGGDFRSPCRPRDGLAGIRFRAGTALDAVTAICVPISSNREEWAGETYEPTQLWGGSGGGRQKIMCQNGDVVRRMRVSIGPWGDILVVKYLTIECEDLASDYTYKVQATKVGTVTKSKWIGCEYNKIGTGLYGRSGNLVDRVGLQCGDYN